MEPRKEMMYGRHTLPSRFWEPQPDEEYLAQFEREAEQNMETEDDEELPFV